AMFIGGVYLIPLFMSNEMASYFATTFSDQKENILRAITGATLILGNQTLAVLLLAAAVLLLVQRTKVLSLAIIALSGIIYILGYRYVGMQRHFLLIFVVLVTCYALAPFYEKDTFN